jgi:uncharacterized RDD family membrane protein YckC
MDIEEIPEEEDTGSHWGRRVGAIIIDFLLVGILTYCIFWAIGMFALDIFWLLTIWSLVFGIVLWIYSGALEGSIGATVGKGIMGLEVVAINSEMTGGKGFARNISKIHWILLLIDTGIGFMTEGDPRQKQADKGVNTIVINTIPVEVPEHRMPYIAPLSTKGEGDDEDRSDWEIPEELLSGNCSSCGTPYKVLPPEDKKSWSGLWNSRCIWCNKMVFEDYKRRKQPWTWNAPKPDHWRSHTSRRWGESPSSGSAPPPSWRSPGPSWR